MFSCPKDRVHFTQLILQLGADSANCTIRVVSPAGNVTTLAGSPGTLGSADGNGSAAQFNGPTAIAVDSAGDPYVTDFYNAVIRKVTASGDVTTLAGKAGSPGNTNGTGTAARFCGPFGLTVDTSKNLFVADTFNGAVREVTSDGIVTTVTGFASGNTNANEVGTTMNFDSPTGVAVDGAGNLYVADFYANIVWKGSPALLISGAGFNSLGQFGFDLAGPVGQIVVVESSTDLASARRCNERLCCN